MNSKLENKRYRLFWLNWLLIGRVCIILMFIFIVIGFSIQNEIVIKIGILLGINSFICALLFTFTGQRKKCHQINKEDFEKELKSFKEKIQKCNSILKD